MQHGVLTTEALEAIEALAKKATPGPWAAGFGGVCVADMARPIRYVVTFDDAGRSLSETDADYIAALSPDVALALCAEIRRLNVAGLHIAQVWSRDYEALKKAKAENAERFQIERDEARAARDCYASEAKRFAKALTWIERVSALRVYTSEPGGGHIAESLTGVALVARALAAASQETP